ncbi:MAG: hypothetical protein AAGC47_12150 [Bacteroidota bacterium]
MRRTGNWKFIFVELIVVFSGVYLAFLLSRYQEDKRAEMEQKKILTAVKYELEDFRLFMPGQAEYMEEKLDGWNQYVGTDSFPDYYTWRFLEPQYQYQILEYALQLENSEIIDLVLYENLSKIYRIIRSLEHTERRMTQFSDNYKPIPDSFSKTSEEYKLLFTESKLNFYKFRSAAYDRMSIKAGLGEISNEVLEVINTYFEEEELKEVEAEVIRRRYSDWGYENDEEKQELVEEIMTGFPRFSEEEIRSFVNEF